MVRVVISAELRNDLKRLVAFAILNEPARRLRDQQAHYREGNDRQGLDGEVEAPSELTTAGFREGRPEADPGGDRDAGEVGEEGQRDCLAAMGRWREFGCPHGGDDDDKGDADAGNEAGNEHMGQVYGGGL